MYAVVWRPAVPVPRSLRPPIRCVLNSELAKARKVTPKGVGVGMCRYVQEPPLFLVLPDK